MDSSEDILQFCVFCLRDTQTGFKNYSFGDNDTILKQFIKLFTRFLRTERKSVDDFDVSNLKCCDECLSIENNFCDFYHHYKCLELQLDWMVLQIERIMRLANKAPSRVSKAKNISKELHLNRPDGWELVNNLREHIIQNCQLKLGRSLPRLSIRRSVSPLPALFQPIYIRSSNESLNLTADNLTENDDHENTAVREYGNDLEDKVNCQGDVNADAIIVATLAEINFRNTNDVVQVKQSVQQSTTHISSPTALIASPLSLDNDNVDLGILHVFKTEPVNDQRIQTENSVNENSVSSACTTKTNQYNVKRKSPQNTAQQTDNNNDDEVTSKKSNKGSLSSISSSSISETSSASSSSSEEDVFDTTSYKLSVSKIRKLRKRYKAQSNPLEYFKCKPCKCRRKFRMKEMYENHFKLHTEGKFSCNFCSKIVPNLVLLCSHEYKVHGKAKEKIPTKDRGFLCPRCPFKGSFFSDYEAHFAHAHFDIGIEPPNRRVFEKCKICNRKISKKVKKSHFKACHDTSKLGDKKILRCKENGCTAYFIRKRQLRYHKNLEHQTKTVKVIKRTKFECDICQVTFSGLASLLCHERQLHKCHVPTSSKDQTNQDDTGKLTAKTTDAVATEKESMVQFQCNFCPTVKENPSALALHEAQKHSSNILSNSKKPSCCPRCPYKYTLKRAYLKHYLHIHLNLLNPDCPSACKLCSGGNVYKANSARHFRDFHQIDDDMEPHKCDKCPAYFRKSLQLQMHTIKIHQQENKCEICGRCMKTRVHLINHMRLSHPGNDENPDLPLGCEFSGGCKKRFQTQAELDHHQKNGHQRPEGWSWSANKNGNVKPKCEKCGKEFSGWSSLETHMSKVHGIKSFVCEECGKSFKTKLGLEYHSDFHKRPEEWKWQCAECGKKCTTKQKLEEHGRKHTKENPFICQFCGERYAHRHNWRNHLTTKHGDEEDVVKMITEKKKGNYLKRKGTKKGDLIMGTK